MKLVFDITLGRGELMTRMQPVKLARTVPVVLSMQDASARNITHHAASSAAYGAGLRASEVCRLKVGDVDSERVVDEAKAAVIDTSREVLNWLQASICIDGRACTFCSQTSGVGCAATGAPM